MKTMVAKICIAILFLAALAGIADGQYMYLSESENSQLGDPVPFRTGDTLAGNLYTTTGFYFEGSPVILGDLYGEWWGGEPQISGNVYPPLPIQIPEQLESLRAHAAAQGNFISGGPDRRYRMILDGSVARLYSWPAGTPFDSLTAQLQTISIHGPMSIFVDGPLDIKGLLTGQLSVGCSGRMRIIDDVRYVDANPYTGIVLPSSNNMLMLASENEIKVANTPENGRENSGGLGFEQTDRSQTSVVITAELKVTGESFTFEDQNDPDSGYVCACTPDERGTIYLYGMLIQRRHGFTWRDNNGGSGYHLRYRYDRRFNTRLPPSEFIEGSDTPDSLDFGNVPVDSTAWDTLVVHTSGYTMLGSVLASPPFTALRQPPYYSSHFNIPVSFTPPRVGNFFSTILVFVAGECRQYYARGRGVAPAGPPLTMDVSPNPFNLTTTIRYTLPAAGDARLTLFNVLGQAVREVDLSGQPAGTQTLRLNATDMATGVYFVHLQMADQAVTRKILLVK